MSNPETTEAGAVTHDYRRRGAGHDYTFRPLDPKGIKGDMAGWGHGIRAGDYLILQH